MCFVKSRSWRRMALNEGTTRRSGSHNVLDASQGRAHTGKRRTYGSQLVRRHCGICRRAINQERSGDGGQLCLFTTPKTTSTHSHRKHNTARLSSGQLREHGEQREWVVWSRDGSGTTCFITPGGIKMKH